MTSIHPYLNFMGNTEEAFNFYRSVFGGQFLSLVRFKDTPEGKKLPEEDQDKIMHMALPIGNGAILMATDALKSAGHSLTFGNIFSIYIQAESQEEADKYFHALSAGGKVEMPMHKTTWDAWFGMFTDKFGVHWMISFTFGEE